MKYPVVLLMSLLSWICAACSAGGEPHLIKHDDAALLTSPAPATPRQTILLVSLEDGTVIMQNIDSSADICFKNNADSATTCLTRGVPVTSPDTNQIIGFEMIEERIDLVAKSN